MSLFVEDLVTKLNANFRTFSEFFNKFYTQKVEDGILSKRNQASPNDCDNLAQYNYRFNVLSFVGLNFFFGKLVLFFVHYHLCKFFDSSPIYSIQPYFGFFRIILLKYFYLTGMLKLLFP